MNEHAALFGVSLEGGSAEEILRAAESSPKPFWIVTANPEILLAAQESVHYATVLRKASWCTVDGFGLRVAMYFRGHHLARVTGVDLAENLLERAAKQGQRVAFFGSNEEVLKKIIHVWRERYPDLALSGWPGGSIAENGLEDAKTVQDREMCARWRPDVLLVALGGGTKQETWIARHLEDFSETRVIVGVGGAFDMWAGRLRRAPHLLRVLGLEWLWRLFLEPRRWKRIWRAVVVFPWRAWRDKTP